eukprot:2144735-Amphidinium_carterae.1
MPRNKTRREPRGSPRKPSGENHGGSPKRKDQVITTRDHPAAAQPATTQGQANKGMEGSAPEHGPSSVAKMAAG